MTCSYAKFKGFVAKEVKIVMKDTFITSRSINSSWWLPFFSFSALVKEKVHIWNATGLETKKPRKNICLPLYMIILRPYVCTIKNVSKQRQRYKTHSRIFFFIRHISVLSKKGLFSLFRLLRHLFLFHHNLSLFFYHAGNGLDLG